MYIPLLNSEWKSSATAFLSESVYSSFYFVQIWKVGRANGRVAFAALNLLLSVLVGCFSSKSIVRILG